MLEIQPLTADLFLRHQSEFRELMKKLSRRKQFRPEYVLATIANELNVVLGAFYDGRLVGTITGCVVQHPLGREWYMHDLVVLEEFKSQGVGGKLEEVFRAYGSEKRCDRIEFTCSRPDAQKWYKRKSRGYTRRETEVLGKDL